MAALAVSVALVSACSGDGNPVAAGRFGPPDTDNLKSGFMVLGNSPRFAEHTSEHYDSMAQFDYVMFGTTWANDDYRRLAGELTERNPDIRKGSYFHVMAMPQWVVQAMNEPEPPTAGWAHDYYTALSPHLARTNALDPATQQPDTAALFKATYAVNLLHPEAREGLVDFYADQERLGLTDWYFMDFFSSPMPDLKLFQDPIYRELEHGDMDLDQDGVGYWDDVDEQQALHEAFIDLLVRLRERLPADLRLIGNGNLPHFDAEFTRLLDGMYIEGVPNWGFQGRGFDGLLDPAYERSLFQLEQRTWHREDFVIMIEDRENSQDFGAIAALFDHVVEYKRSWGTSFGGDPDAELYGIAVDQSRSLAHLGRPLGPAQRKDVVDPATGARLARVTRRFAEGTVVVECGPEPLELSAGVR
jgi:hypothetical protein